MRILLTGALAALAVAACAGSAAARPSFDPMKMLAESDANRDGAVTRAEFIDARRARFARMDRNHDGYASADDLPRRMKRRGGGDRMDELRQAMDANRDGRVSRDEFVHGPALLFDRGDRNRDNVLDRSEMDQLRTAMAARTR